MLNRRNLTGRKLAIGKGLTCKRSKNCLCNCSEGRGKEFTRYRHSCVTGHCCWFLCHIANLNSVDIVFFIYFLKYKNTLRSISFFQKDYRVRLRVFSFFTAQKLDREVREITELLSATSRHRTNDQSSVHGAMEKAFNGCRGRQYLSIDIFVWKVFRKLSCGSVAQFDMEVPA